MAFTLEELAEMARADAEIEAEFDFLTDEELELCRQLERTARTQAMDPARRKVAESQRRYYAANKEQIAESKQAIQAARKAAGLTQKAAAQLFGVTQGTISYWERVSAPENWREVVANLEAAVQDMEG